ALGIIYQTKCGVNSLPLMPANAGIQTLAKELDPRFPPSLKLRRTTDKPVEALAKAGRRGERTSMASRRCRHFTPRVEAHKLTPGATAMRSGTWPRHRLPPSATA